MIEDKKYKPKTKKGIIFNKNDNMNLIKIFTLILLIICSFINLQGQNKKIDSLWNAYKHAKHDSTRCRLLLSIGGEYEKTTPDTVLLWYNKVYTTAIKPENKEDLFKIYSADALLSSGRVECYYKANYETSLEYSDRAINIFKKLSETNSNKKILKKAKKGISGCYYNIGVGYYYQGSYDKAIEYYLKSLKIKKELQDKKGMFNCYICIGNVHNSQGSYDKAIEYYLKSLKITEELLDKKGMSLCYNHIGIVHSNQGSYDKAIEYYMKALKINEELQDKNGISQCYGNIGLVYSDQGSYDKSIEYYLKALKITEKLGDKKGMSACYTNIGIVHDVQGSYDKAIEYYLKALKIDEKLGDKKGMAYCYTNIGLVHYSQSSYNKAIEYYLKALKITEELGDRKGMAYCIENIGNIHDVQGSYDKAIEYYLKALKITEESGDKNGIVACYINIGSLNISLADSAALSENQKLQYLNKAVEFGTKTIQLAREIKAMPRENEAANTLMNAYKKLGNYKKAMEYADIFISTKDTMFSEEKNQSPCRNGR